MHPLSYILQPAVLIGWWSHTFIGDCTYSEMFCGLQNQRTRCGNQMSALLSHNHLAIPEARSSSDTWGAPAVCSKEELVLLAQFWVQFLCQGHCLQWDWKDYTTAKLSARILWEEQGKAKEEEEKEKKRREGKPNQQRGTECSPVQRRRVASGAMRICITWASSTAQRSLGLLLRVRA